MNSVSITGRLTRDPEVRTITNGDKVVNFTVAVARKRAKEGAQNADFVPCVAWSKTAEFIGNYFGKGKKIEVVGEIRTRSYEDQEGNRHNIVEVLVNSAEFAESKAAQSQKNEDRTINGHQLPDGVDIVDDYGDPVVWDDDPDDDLPF